MARSAHAYMRGNTIKFYEWLEASNGHAIPDGPPIWICGDCHVGNLGPVADSKGNVSIQIRDLDQTVIGNPAHDLIRLALSLATAARGSDLPGVTTAHIVENMMDGYETALGRPKQKPAADHSAVEIADDHAGVKLEDQSGVKPEDGSGMEPEDDHWVDAPVPVTNVLKKAFQRRWRHLAQERIEDVRPQIPLGKRFWPLSDTERAEMQVLARSENLRQMLTHVYSRRDDAKLEIVDAAYWVKGCSSLGRLRYAVLARLKGGGGKSELCLIDIKEAIQAAAPRATDTEGARLPANSAERVVMGARALAPALGNRMIAAEFLGKTVIVRELLPQDLKIEMEQLTRGQASKAARYLGNVVGVAHARQMTPANRRAWRETLQRQRSSDLDAPHWLWRSVVDLVGAHEKSYLDHCRRFALEPASASA